MNPKPFSSGFHPSLRIEWKWFWCGLTACISVLYPLVGVEDGPPSLVDRLRLYAPFEKVDASDGLSNLTVTCILQDSRGFVWIGTLDGLNLYDGQSFHVFKTREGDHSSISSVSIWSICEDRSGQIWIATGLGLNRFDPQTGTFTSYLHDPEDPTSISSNLLRVVFVDRKGRLWVGTDGKGLNRFDANSGKFEHFTSRHPDGQAISGDNVWTIYEDSQNRIWVGTTQGGLVYWDDDRAAFETVIAVPPSSPGSADTAVMSFLEIDVDRYWIGTLGEGILELDYSDGSLTQLGPGDFSGNDFGRVVKRMLHDRNGNIWIATHEGLMLLNRDRSDSILFRRDVTDPLSIASSQIWSLHCDRSGDIWTGHYNAGVSWLSLQNLGFTTIRKPTGLESGLSDDPILSFVETEDGTLYIGTDGGGLYVTDASFERFRQIPIPPLDGSAPNLAILSMQEDADGQIWMGTWGGGLVAFDPVSGQLRHYWDDLQQSRHTVNNPYVWSVEISRDGRIWAATEGGGLNRLDPNTGLIDGFMHDASDPASLSNNNVWRVYEDSRARLWIGTQDGLNLLNPDGERFTLFLSNPLDPTSLSNGWIKSIAEDREGNLWFGTDGGGLNRLNEHTGQFTHIGLEDGLRSGVIQHIEVDEENRIWVSSNHGISSITLGGTERGIGIENYDASFGLQGNQFGLGSGQRLRDGRIVFGGLNGFSVFHPDEISPVDRYPALHITGFWTTDQLIESDDDLLLDQSYRQIRGPVRLAYDDNDFLIQFVSIEFFSRNAARTQYRLEGYEESWSTAGPTERRVRYANIPPGTYRFQLRHDTDHEVGGKVQDFLVIEIQKAWWMHWWVVVPLVLAGLIVSLVGVLIYMGVLHRQKKLLQQKVTERTAEIAQKSAEIDAQNQELSEKNASLLRLDEEKNFLLRAVAHDLRDPLAQISGLVELILMKPEEHNAENLQLIQSRVEDLMGMISKILNMRAIEENEISTEFSRVSVLEELEHLIASKAGSLTRKRIRAHLIEPSKPCFVWADRKLLQLVLENLVSNAIKYAPFDTVITLRCAEAPMPGHIRIEVQDQGPGISEADQCKLFQRFQRLSSVPTNGEASIGLGLAIVKKYVETMNGSVWCESVLGSGSTFIVELPAADEAVSPPEGSM